MRKLNLLWILPLVFFLTHTALAADPKPVFIGFDGEYGLKNSTSAQAIEKGLMIAIDEINASGGVLGGRSLQLLTRDNRSVPARGVQNITIFAQQKDLVAVVGGRFSPVILSEIDTIHEQKVILMDAWGSADGITDHKYNPSYTFRVSLRDRFAMPTMLRHAQSKKARRIGILVPNTGWGRSNVLASERYISETGAAIETNVIWYNWGDQDFATPYKAFQNWGAEALVMVANDLEGSGVVRYVASLAKDQRLPIISHWGVTGGQFVKASKGGLDKIDFSVVQTFSLFKADPTMRDHVMGLLTAKYGIKNIEDVESPVGFGHAYDIVHILARAIDLAGTTDRDAVRDALERVSDYKGLVRTYDMPFGPGDHDALELSDVFMAKFDENGVIRPLNE